MIVSEPIKAALILLPILTLLGLGFVLTLKSGVVQMTTSRGARQVVGNLSQTLLMVAGCLVGLAVLQQVVGFRMGLAW